MFNIPGYRNEVLKFLVSQKAISSIEKNAIQKESTGRQDEKILNVLNDSVKQEKLQMVHYEWSILPNFYMVLQIIGLTDSKVFEYEK